MLTRVILKRQGKLGVSSYKSPNSFMILAYLSTLISHHSPASQPHIWKFQVLTYLYLTVFFANAFHSLRFILLSLLYNLNRYSYHMFLQVPICMTSQHFQTLCSLSLLLGPRGQGLSLNCLTLFPILSSVSDVLTGTSQRKKRISFVGLRENFKIANICCSSPLDSPTNINIWVQTMLFLKGHIYKALNSF